MNKHELLYCLDQELLDKLFGFCYARTNNSHEAEDLASDITLEIVKLSNGEGEIENAEAYIWRVARNVYAKYSERRREERKRSFTGDIDDFLSAIADEEPIDDGEEENLSRIFRSISFLSRSYRDVTIAFYLDSKPTAQIADELGISDTAVRQRLYYSRNAIRNEVLNMDKIQKPTLLNKIDYVIWGTGNPGWSDPRNVCDRQLSFQIMYLVSQKPRSAKEISDELSVPMIYIEDELNVLCKGQYGRYGALRKLDSGKYAMNFVLLNKEQIEKAWAIYEACIPEICKTVKGLISEKKDELLSLPFLNKKVTLNAVLWQQIQNMAWDFNSCVKKILEEKYFPGVNKPDRPFTVFGYEDNGAYWGGGCDGIEARNILGYSYVFIKNIYGYGSKVKLEPHFHCGNNISNDEKLQIAIRSIDGLDVNSLSETEKEAAAKAIDEGYVYRESDMLFTKFLVLSEEDRNLPDNITDEYLKPRFAPAAEKVAEKMAKLIKEVLPEHLINEYRMVASLADMPVLDSLILNLIEEGVLTMPEGNLNAETVFMTVRK